MKKVFAVRFAAAALGVLFAVTRLSASEESSLVAEEEARINAEISSAVEEIFTDLPRRIDKETTLVKAENVGRSLRYTYELDITAQDVGGSWSDKSAAMQKKNQTVYCFEDAYDWYRQNNAPMEWVYIDKNKKPAFEVSAAVSDCKLIKASVPAK